MTKCKKQKIRIAEIENLSESLIAKIKEYEQNCIEKYNELKESMHQAKELIKKVNDLIQQSKDYVNQLQIDDTEIATFNQKMQSLKMKLAEERRNVKSAMFNNQLMQFEMNETPASEEFLGCLEYKKINFSVIYCEYFLFNIFVFLFY